MIYSDEHIAKIRDFDFFKKDRLDCMNDGLRTVKAWGEYREIKPYISFVVTTYKRPLLLKCMLESIISQNYNDCEIIVVDNECADVSEDTETQKLIRDLNNPKIVYFRNIDPMIARMDRAASFARGEWICFCHDDDILASNHLETMLPIIKEHPEIKFLSCGYRMFYDEEFDKVVYNGFIANNWHEGVCRESCLEECAFFRQGGWTGALIKRQLYEEMGGMPKVQCGCGDQIMCCKFIYHYDGFYRLRAPLYFYRISKNQIASSEDNWFNTYVSQYFFSRYMLMRMNKVPKVDYEQLCLAFVLQMMKSTEKTWGFKFDYHQYAEKCNVKILDDDNMINCYVRKWEGYEKEITQEKEQSGFEIYLDKAAKNPY